MFRFGLPSVKCQGKSALETSLKRNQAASVLDYGGFLLDCGDRGGVATSSSSVRGLRLAFEGRAQNLLDPFHRLNFQVVLDVVRDFHEVFHVAFRITPS